MNLPHKVGDRVRLTTAHRHPHFLVRDLGTVLAVLPPSPGRALPLYHVQMDRAEQYVHETFYADELEPVPFSQIPTPRTP
jgi:hypothetical protein